MTAEPLLEFDTKAILFDLYGTLADIVTDETSDRFWARVAAARGARDQADGEALRRRYESLCAREHGRGQDGFMLPTVFFELLRTPTAEPSSRDIADFARKFRAESILRLEAKTYATDLLSMIRGAGLATGIVSNTESLLTNYDLERLGLRAHVDVTVLSSELGVAKPDPAILRYAMDHLGVSAEQTIFVGDTEETDVEAALAADVRVLCISSETPKPRYVAAGVAYAPPTLEGVVEALKSVGAPI